MTDGTSRPDPTGDPWTRRLNGQRGVTTLTILSNEKSGRRWRGPSRVRSCRLPTILRGERHGMIQHTMAFIARHTPGRFVRSRRRFAAGLALAGAVALAAVCPADSVSTTQPANRPAAADLDAGLAHATQPAVRPSTQPSTRPTTQPVA